MASMKQRPLALSVDIVVKDVSFNFLPGDTCRAMRRPAGSVRKEWQVTHPPYPSLPRFQILANILLRAELNPHERRQYIKAVKCLHDLPSKISPTKAPGARSRLDDFQAAHIINTRIIHATGLFFAWHRDQPYWDWARWADYPTTANPLYDGSATSLSGNGKFIPNRNGTLQPFPIPVPNPPAIYIPPGTGGGYIFSAPS
ncbi:hypothetical protein M7I_6638 [Glarea lozoyensis 74030]|uniref:Tyrosinase copper-binding domain-containing protein n=1 Tax=Glarea lozoyensis (strain ATCC 74030 / MF5533) TaxID=1104152 RepID=H0EV45_GLAL7|nr:hypothetical protein M7I_6638 [Glarea lozoyensis 74030]